MKIRTHYFDMLDGRYRVAVQLGQCYVTTNKGNRYARTKVKAQYKSFYNLQIGLHALSNLSLNQGHTYESY